MNRKDIIPFALASGFERVEKEYQFMPDTYEVSASDLELFVEKLTCKPLTEPELNAIEPTWPNEWDYDDVLEFVRTIERAHGIGEA